jgi:hypothetical protein
MSTAAAVMTDLGQRPAARRGGMRAHDLACVLLLLQASMALVSSSIVLSLAATGFPVPPGKLGAVGLLALIHPTFLVVVAIGVARAWRWARRAAIVFESVTIAGTLLNLVLNVLPRVQTESGPLVLLVNLLLPALIVALLKSRRRPWRLPSAWAVAATLIGTSAAIHAALASSHATEVPELGPLFRLDALLLTAAVVGAILAHRWPRVSILRRWRPLAVGLLVANILAYVAYIGSGREHVEQAALAVKLAELVALGLLLLPTSGDGEPTARRPRRPMVVMVGTMLLLGLLTGLAAWGAGFRPHHIPAAGEAAHEIEPVPGHNVRRKVIGPVTPENEAATTRLVEETRAGAARYANLQAAYEAGYVGAVNGPNSHLENKAFKNDDAVLDPTRPEQLVYAATPEGPLLLGVVYVMPTPERIGPEIGGSLTPWHTHTLCITILPPFIAGLMTPFGTCPFGAANLVMPEMMHVWIVENPTGQVGDRLDPVVLRARGIN